MNDDHLINLVFVSEKMNIGGIEMALLNMIKALDRRKYKIHLLLFKIEGELITSLPPDVQIHQISPESLNQSYKRGGMPAFLYGLIYRAFIRMSARNYPKAVALTSKLCRFPINIQCDILIIFSSLRFPFLWGSQQKHDPKLLFIHQSWFSECYEKMIRDNIQRFRKVICVSEAAKKYVDSHFPQSASNTIVIHNILCPERIKSLSIIPTGTEIKHLCILTVARLAEAKGCQFIPRILHRIIECGYTVYWYIIGDGVLYQEIKMMIEKMNLQKFIFLLGAKENPYPYIKECDIYVQPSIHEGYGISLQEAKILCKPIVATDIPAFRELIVSGLNGTLAVLNHSSIICEQYYETQGDYYWHDKENPDIDIQGFANAIIDLIIDQNKRNRYSEWLYNHPIDANNDELIKLDEVFMNCMGKM